MKTLAATGASVLLVLAAISALALSRAVHASEPEANAVRGDFPASAYIVGAGSLPGVTWADDIHPIFTRNGCIDCHLRGNELYVEDLGEFRLGLVDPLDSANPDYSYHELVYAEGPPHKIEGESLRDGQCCWPFGYPEEKQRRIWIGHSGRSAIVHKLDRDYYDWDGPPRFLEEALRLRWGLPMPWKKFTDDEPPLHKPLKRRGYLAQLLIYIQIWLGTYGTAIELRPLAPARDRAFLRYWIDHAVQLQTGETGIEVRVEDPRGTPAQGAEVTFVGNFNNPSRTGVSDAETAGVDEQGRASLTFPSGSVVTSFWFVKARKSQQETDFVPLTIRDGETAKLTLTLTQPR